MTEWGVDLKQADILIGAICELIVRAGRWHRILPICFTAPYRIRQELGAERSIANDKS